MLNKKDEMQRRYAFIKDSLNKLYIKYGYEEITIPMFMPYDLFTKYKLNHNNEQLKLIDGTGNILVIRPDATFHVLKTVLNMRKKENEKYFYNAKVFRNLSKDYTLAEINQAGVECFGASSSIIDSDIIVLALNSLLSLGINDIRLDLSHADFVYSLIEEIDEIKKDEVEIVHKYIEQKNRIALESYLVLKGVGEEYKNKLIEICMLFGDFEEVLLKARTIAINDKMHNALDKISEVYELLKIYGLDKYVYLDLGFTNQMNYYSGIMFKLYSVDAGREVITGGRYDRLAKKFAGRNGACGFSQDLDLTCKLVNQATGKNYSYLDYEVHINKENDKDGILLAKNLREVGKNATVVRDEDFYILDVKNKKKLTKENIKEILGE